MANAIFNLKVDPSKLRASLEAEVKKFYGTDALDAVGMEARNIIVERTRTEKVDVSGKAFEPPYSKHPLYISLKHQPAPKGGIKTPQTRRKVANFNQKTGAAHSVSKTLTPKSHGGTSMFFPGGYQQYRNFSPTVNLDATGVMLNSLMPRRTNRNTIILWFATTGGNDRAMGHDAGIPGRLPQRHFFGIERKQDLDRLTAAWERQVKQRGL